MLLKKTLGEIFDETIVERLGRPIAIRDVDVFFNQLSGDDKLDNSRTHFTFPEFLQDL